MSWSRCRQRRGRPSFATRGAAAHPWPFTAGFTTFTTGCCAICTSRRRLPDVRPQLTGGERAPRGVANCAQGTEGGALAAENGARVPEGGPRAAENGPRAATDEGPQATEGAFG